MDAAFGGMASVLQLIGLVLLHFYADVGFGFCGLRVGTYRSKQR